MSFLSTPERVRAADVIASAVFLVAALLVIPDGVFQNVDWLVGLIVILIMFVSGLISSWFYYRTHGFNQLDPFYIRAWWSLIGGVVALPICMLFRPSALPGALIALAFGAGPVIAFQLYRRITKRKWANPK